MKNLYIDFDGVILDTITPVYNLAKKLNLTSKELLEKADKPVYAKNVAIGTAYEMNDEAYGGMGQAITVAEVKGSTYPDERVFLCAHVQEPGSNDNATGVATLLGMATEYKRMIDAGEIEVF